MNKPIMALATLLFTLDNAIAESYALLNAIAQIESGGRDSVTGSRGERGRYQIRQSTWEHFSSLPFRKAYNERESTIVAKQVFMWNADYFLSQTKRHASPQEMYVMWNWGVGNFKHAKFDTQNVPRSIRERAQRCENVYVVTNPLNKN